ncbi:glycerophosphodiester phosphodiesterase family protein [Hutsoniella sourekii]|uniref:glycerophosphodiester phosphodiesterase family protein n=1 Tax=Hutsoniella sourekii TaxID=87650 RepID=UPI0004AF3644|nr:glycerophosphodiester phosphodiesterase family protein [Hutsoniella sourekii]
MVQLIAQRGISQLYPENTLPAFQAALDYHADGLAFELHLTADGYPVIHRDEQIHRTSNGQGWIQDLTLMELRQYSFTGSYTIDEKINLLTLEEFLEEFSATNLVFYIELKNDFVHYKGLESKVLELLKQFQVLDRSILASSNHRSIATCLAYYPDLVTSLTFKEMIPNIGEYAFRFGVSDITVPTDMVDDHLFNSCLDNGININIYDIVEAEFIKNQTNSSIKRLICACLNQVHELR